MHRKDSIRSVREVDWDAHKFTEDAVLCFVYDKDKVMLIHKKTGLGAGKINAPGGRIEKDELPMTAAVRETFEETGVEALDLELVGELNFIFIDGYSLRGFVYFAKSYKGTPVPTPEADPFWCSINEIPYERMWADDKVWLPRALTGEKILGRFIFDGDVMLDAMVRKESRSEE